MHEVIINFESFEMYDDKWITTIAMSMVLIGIDQEIIELMCSYIKFRNYYWVIYNVNVSKAII